ncbi:MAG: FCSD flavin-binding domain-containing protein [Halothiobacillaceae bacterium]
MSRIARRDFLKLLGAGTLAGTSFTVGKTAFAGAQPHVVVIGGGVGGATFAKYLRMADPNVKVTIVEMNRKYLRPYGSSEVITGHLTMDDLTISYDALRDKYGIEFLIDRVTGIDFDKQSVRTADGTTLNYDRLVVSPGISIDFDAVEGLDQQVSDTKIPHAWIPGAQTELMARQLKEVPEGGTVIVAPPPNPYRCPPGPYERAGLFAQWFKDHGNPSAKVVILDPKNGFTTDFTMLHVWNKLYGFNVPELARGLYTEEQLAQLTEHEGPGMIEWVMGDMGGRVLRVDPDAMVVETEMGQYEADMINIIPPLKAGQIALDTGLADSSGWCPIERKTFESQIAKNVHVLGDSCIADEMPKSGYSANSQAKVVALQVKALLAGQEPGTPIWQNTCYALAGNIDYGMFVADVFRLKDGHIRRLDNPRYLPFDATEMQYRLAALYQQNWMQAFTEDCFA